MTPQHLAMAMADFLADAHKDFVPSDPKLHGRAIQCVPGYLKERTRQEDAAFPHIAIRINQVHDDADVRGESTATLHIIIGTYCTDNEDGWLEIVNLVESTRQAMLKHRTIDNKYRLQGAVDATIPSEQPRPVWVAVITATYTIKDIREELQY